MTNPVTNLKMLRSQNSEAGMALLRLMVLFFVLTWLGLFAAVAEENGLVPPVYVPNHEDQDYNAPEPPVIHCQGLNCLPPEENPVLECDGPDCEPTPLIEKLD
jgi:hypothetical protein